MAVVLCYTECKYIPAPMYRNIDRHSLTRGSAIGRLRAGAAAGGLTPPLRRSQLTAHHIVYAALRSIPVPFRGLGIFYHFSAFLSNILTLPDLTPFVREGIINIRIGRCRQTGGPSVVLQRSNRRVGAGAVTSFYFETVRFVHTALRR